MSMTRWDLIDIASLASIVAGAAAVMARWVGVVIEVMGEGE